MEDELFAESERDYAENPIGKSEVMEKIHMMLSLFKGERVQYGMLVNLLAFKYKCAPEIIIDAVDSLAQQGAVARSTNYVYLLGGNDMNEKIRMEMRNYIDENGPQETKFMIKYFSDMWKVTTHCISGNISAMATKFGTCTVKNDSLCSIMS